MLSSKRGKIRIACVGDSITYGYRIHHRHLNSSPSRLQRMLGDGHEVGNFGLSGLGILKSSMKGKQPRAFHFSKEHRKALDFKPHMVVCNLGINDLIDYQTTHECGRRGTFGESFVSDYKELIRDYQQLDSDPTILVWGPLAPLFPGQNYYGSPVVSKINHDIKQAVNELNLPRKGKEIGLINMYDSLLPHEKLFRDKLHPNKVGAHLIAEIVFKSVKKYLSNEHAH